MRRIPYNEFVVFKPCLMSEDVFVRERQPILENGLRLQALAMNRRFLDDGHSWLRCQLCPEVTQAIMRHFGGTSPMRIFGTESR